MERVCSWCQEKLPDLGNYHDDGVTHGACHSCKERYLRSRDPRTLREVLDRYPTPVLVVDEFGSIVTANRAALHALGKPAARMEGRLGGEAMDCLNASLPGGCGKTERCKTCAIRNAVEESHRTHQGISGIVAFQDVRIRGRQTRVRFLISTEIVGNNVFLTLAEIEPVKETDATGTPDPGSG